MSSRECSECGEALALSNEGDLCGECEEWYDRLACDEAMSDYYNHRINDGFERIEGGE